jgi:hypothetical protein
MNYFYYYFPEKKCMICFSEEKEYIYFLILFAWQRSNKYQFYSLLCDPISLEPIRGFDANNYTTDMVLDQHALLDF